MGNPVTSQFTVPNILLNPFTPPRIVNSTIIVLSLVEPLVDNSHTVSYVASSFVTDMAGNPVDAFHR